MDEKPKKKRRLWALVKVAVGLWGFGIVFTLIAGVGNKTETPVTASYATKLASEPETLVNVCKSVIAAITTSNSHESMNGVHSGGISDIWYIRDSDKKKFKSQCKYFPTSPTTGEVVWRGVDVWEPGSGPGIWREREYDEIVNYWSEKDAKNIETITLEILDTGADRIMTGKRKIEIYKFETAGN